MSKPFSQIKSSKLLGLYDQMPYGRHVGYKVIGIIYDRPEYIGWLINNTNQRFTDEVVTALAIHYKPKEKSHIYTGQLRGDLAHYEAEFEAIAQDAAWGFDDVPF